MGQAVYLSLLQVSFCGNAKLILQTPQPQTLTRISLPAHEGMSPSLYSHRHSLSSPVLCRLVPWDGHVALRGMPCLSFRGVLWVTLNCPFSGIGLSMLSLSHLYKLNLSIVQHYTPMKTYNLQRYSTKHSSTLYPNENVQSTEILNINNMGESHNHNVE